MKLTLKVWRRSPAPRAGARGVPLEDVGPVLAAGGARQAGTTTSWPVARTGGVRLGLPRGHVRGVRRDRGAGRPTALRRRAPSCRQRLRSFEDGAAVQLEPFRRGASRSRPRGGPQRAGPGDRGRWFRVPPPWAPPRTRTPFP
ncbi:hypothetical protein QJS66_21375 [Kocuria rhizophila]|nr:hypothetical protein QJS66_21375 [Kocuria rhizophila]